MNSKIAQMLEILGGQGLIGFNFPFFAFSDSKILKLLRDFYWNHDQTTGSNSANLTLRCVGVISIHV